MPVINHSPDNLLLIFQFLSPAFGGFATGVLSITCFCNCYHNYNFKLLFVVNILASICSVKPNYLKCWLLFVEDNRIELFPCLCNRQTLPLHQSSILLSIINRNYGSYDNNQHLYPITVTLRCSYCEGVVYYFYTNRTFLNEPYLLFTTPILPQYGAIKQMLHFGETGWHRFCP